MSSQEDRNGSRFRALEQLVADEAPGFALTMGPVCTLRGPLVLKHPADGQYLDRWDIEIAWVPDEYRRAPRVRELGGRIPHVADRHMFVDGTACLFVPEETWRHYPPGMTITQFLRGPVRNYFLAQTYFEQEGRWPPLPENESAQSDRSHGAAGRLEYLAEELGSTDPAVALRFLDYLSTEWTKGHRPCYCGSGHALRNCHLETLNTFRSRICPALARAAASQIRQHLAEQS